MVPEARLNSTEHGLVPEQGGWFVLNARDAQWCDAKGRAALCVFEGEIGDFAQLGISLEILRPGDVMAI